MLAPTSLSLPDTHQSQQHVHLTLFEEESEKQVNWRKTLPSVYTVSYLTELGGQRFIRTDRENVWMWWWTEVKCGGFWGGGRGLSCGPALRKADSLDRRTVVLVQARSAHAKGRVEVGPVLIAVATLAAQAVGWRAALWGQSLLWGWSLVLLRVGRGWGIAARCGAAGAVSRRRNRFGLDVQALGRGQGEIWTLT